MVFATNTYSIIEAGTILAGVALLALVIGVVIIVSMHVDMGHAIIPWGHRKRVERAKADREVAEQRVEAEIAELKHLALQPVRNKLLNGVESGDVQPLHELLAGGDNRANGDAIRKAAWGEEETARY